MSRAFLVKIWANSNGVKVKIYIIIIFVMALFVIHVKHVILNDSEAPITPTNRKTIYLSFVR